MAQLARALRHTLRPRGLSTDSCADLAGPAVATLAPLAARGVVRLYGADTLGFLQGLLTNDTRPLEAAVQGAAVSPLYAALLTPQGRFLYDGFFFSRTSPGGVPCVLADVDLGALPELLSHLRKYRLRAAVDVADVSDEHRVWAHFGPSAVPPATIHADDSTEASTAAAAAVSSVGAAAVDGGWSVDPRLHVLGSRGVFPADVVPAAPSASTGALVGDERLSAAAAAAAAGSSAAEEAGEAEYRHFLWRVAHGVGEGPVEIPHAEALPLEYNLAGLNAVSFKKGCYLGQELTARSHFRGVVRKRLMPVALCPGPDAAAAVAVGSTVVDAALQKKTGRVNAVTRDGGAGLALLRLKPALNATTAADLRIETGGGARVTPQRPTWWPEQWGREEEDGGSPL